MSRTSPDPSSVIGPDSNAFSAESTAGLGSHVGNPGVVPDGHLGSAVLDPQPTVSHVRTPPTGQTLTRGAPRQSSSPRRDQGTNLNAPLVVLFAPVPLPAPSTNESLRLVELAASLRRQGKEVAILFDGPSPNGGRTHPVVERRMRELTTAPGASEPRMLVRGEESRQLALARLVGPARANVRATIVQYPTSRAKGVYDDIRRVFGEAKVIAECTALHVRRDDRLATNGHDTDVAPQELVRYDGAIVIDQQMARNIQRSLGPIIASRSGTSIREIADASGQPRITLVPNIRRESQVLNAEALPVDKQNAIDRALVGDALGMPVITNNANRSLSQPDMGLAT